MFIPIAILALIQIIIVQSFLVRLFPNLFSCGGFFYVCEARTIFGSFLVLFSAAALQAIISFFVSWPAGWSIVRRNKPKQNQISPQPPQQKIQ